LFYRLFIFLAIWLNFSAVAVTFSVAQAPPGFGSPPPQAQAQVESKTISINVVEGRLVGSFDFVTRKTTASVSLYIDLEPSNGLSLDSEAMGEFGLDTGKGFMTIKSTDGFSSLVRVKSIAELAPDKKMASLSSLFAKELDNRPIVGSIGLGLLRKFHLSFNVKEGKITLSAPKPSDIDVTRIEGDVIVSMSRLGDGGIVLPILRDGSSEVELKLSLGQYDTRIDQTWAAETRYPAGNIPNIELKGLRAANGLNLSQSMAFRPDSFGNDDFGNDKIKTGNAAVKFISGTNLFLNNIVDIDMVNEMVIFTALSDVEYPKADFAFFSAMISEQDGQLITYLNQYPKSRLAPEAAGLVLEQRIKRASTNADILEAVKFVRDTSLPRNRGGITLGLMQRMKDAFPGRQSLHISVAKLGVKVARHDEDPANLYKLHKAIGFEYLQAGNVREAWRGLLSAAFGLPRDPMVNYGLGQVYEQQKRLKRAQSRYQRALELLAEGDVKDMKSQTKFQQALERVENALPKTGGHE